jgi:hypothetical protein
MVYPLNISEKEKGVVGRFWVKRGPLAPKFGGTGVVRIVKIWGGILGDRHPPFQPQISRQFLLETGLELPDRRPGLKKPR